VNHERAGQFLVEAAIALMDADLNRAVEQLEEALAREAWISGFFMQGTCPQGSPVEVSTGSTSAVSEGQADIELTGVRYGVPVLLRAWLNEESCAEKGIDDPGSVFGELIRIFAKRLGSQYLVGRAGERELADAVGALSHDFRTPLACIKGYLSLLAEGKYRPGTPEWDEYFATVLEECERLENLVSVVLESTAARKVGVSREPVLLPPLINRVLVEESSIARGHRFFVDLQPESREVFADPIRLEQVLRNLLDNAVKYSPEGSLIVLRVRKTRGGHLFSVADQGGGIAPEHLNRLFERHYRVMGRDSDSIKGTGLGLLIARQVVNAHGGDIWAESVVGKGSTFYFTIPDYEGDR
jgi:signal transduction histidine kinase